MKIFLIDVFFMKEAEYLNIVREVNIYYLTLSVGLGASSYLFQEDLKKNYRKQTSLLILFSILLSFYSYTYSFAEKHIDFSKAVLAFNTILIAGLIFKFILTLNKSIEKDIEVLWVDEYIAKIRKLLESIKDGSYTEITMDSKEENKEEYELLMLMKDKDLIEADLTYGQDEFYFFKQDIRLRWEGHDFLLKLYDDSFIEKSKEYFRKATGYTLGLFLTILIEKVISD